MKCREGRGRKLKGQEKSRKEMDREGRRGKEREGRRRMRDMKDS